MAVDYNELLYEKVQAEYDAFIEELKRMTPEQVIVPSPKKQTKNAGVKPNEKNNKYDIKLLYSTAFIPRFA